MGKNSMNTATNETKACLDNKPLLKSLGEGQFAST